MAMIQCPQCGESISEKAPKCIHCGLILTEEPKKTCPECGEELENGVLVCPKCGCPIEQENTAEAVPQQVEITSVKLKSGINKKQIVRIVIIAVVAIFSIVGIVFGIKYASDKKAEQELAQLSADYEENLNTITFTMLNGAADAESCGNLIKKVWSNSIYEERDSETDPYTRPNGYFVDDFNEALGNLFSDSSFQTKIERIKSNQDTVNSMMKNMKNPPEEWEDAYEALKDYYDKYLELTNLAISPSGSLQTYSTNFNSADSELLNRYNKMNLYLN